MSPAGSDVRHSSHLCLPFETNDEKHAATVTFIHEGLSRGARCLYVGTKDDFDTLGRGLEELGICTRRASSRGALMYRTVEEVYLYGGVFDPPRALDHTDALIDAALVDGFTGLRITAELTRIPADGEWQKIVLSRAFMRDAPLLILDEPTANLDPASAELVRAAVDRCRQGRTVLVIAHDDELASRADRIVRLTPAAS